MGGFDSDAGEGLEVVGVDFAEANAEGDVFHVVVSFEDFATVFGVGECFGGGEGHGKDAAQVQYADILQRSNFGRRWGHGSVLSFK